MAGNSFVVLLIGSTVSTAIELAFLGFVVFPFNDDKSFFLNTRLTFTGLVNVIVFSIKQIERIHPLVYLLFFSWVS